MDLLFIHPLVTTSSRKIRPMPLVILTWTRALASVVHAYGSLKRATWDALRAMVLCLRQEISTTSPTAPTSLPISRPCQKSSGLTTFTMSLKLAIGLVTTHGDHQDEHLLAIHVAWPVLTKSQQAAVGRPHLVPIRVT